MSIVSGIKTLLIDRRLPYRAERMLNAFLLKAGSRERTISASGLRFKVRRSSVDEDFVANVVCSKEYLPDGIKVDSGDWVIDIGGNIGTFAVLMASLGARVVTAEPDPDNVRLLKENVELNSVKVAIEPVAVAGSRRVVILHQSKEGSGFHSIVNPQTGGGISVTAVLLDDLFEKYGIEKCDFLKLDCEGAEYELLEASRTLHRVRQVAMEYHVIVDCDDLEKLSRRVIELFPHLSVVKNEMFPAFGCGHLFLA